MRGNRLPKGLSHDVLVKSGSAGAASRGVVTGSRGVDAASVAPGRT